MPSFPPISSSDKSDLIASKRVKQLANKDDRLPVGGVSLCLIWFKNIHGEALG